MAESRRISYDSATPTSGAHWVRAPGCGIYKQPLELELAVHALEHGAVALWHRTDLGEDEVADLRDLARRWDSHVIVAPNHEIDDAVVATAWNRLLRYDAVGEPIAEFIDVYRRRGPENVARPM